MGSDKVNPTTGDTVPYAAFHDVGNGPGDSPDNQMPYDVTFEFSLECQVLTDGQGLIVGGNHAAAALLRCPKEYLAGKPLGLFVAEGGFRPRFYESLSRLWQGATSDTFETRLGRRGEAGRDVRVLVSSDADQTQFRWLLQDVTDLKRAEADRAELLRKLVSAQEDERRRVARDLHDNVSQLLTALTMGLNAVEESGPLPPESRAPFKLVRRVVGELSRTVRELTFNLRPVALDELGLHVALEQSLAEWSARQSAVSIEFRADALASERLPPEVETAIYRVVQESLTNIIRHARARHVGVEVQWRDGLVTASVRDDGDGFDPEAVAGPAQGKRLGLVGMRERVALAGGTLDVRSSPGKGTTVTAHFPAIRNRKSDVG